LHNRSPANSEFTTVVDLGKQNRKTPAEAAGSFAQVAHDGGNAVNYNATQPFRATGAGDSAPKNYKANDQKYTRIKKMILINTVRNYYALYT
jgi:hypothetical protein